MSAAIAVIAKRPVPGRVKTRLSPPCTPEQAAQLAAASLADVLAAADAAAGERRRVAVFDGDPEGVVPDAFDVIAQRDGGLDARLAGAFDDLQGPALIVGMDTPQVTAEHIALALGALDEGAPAVLGMAEDGGYWCIGLQGPCPEALLGVPMSRDDTGARQVDRLRELGLEPVLVDPLLDVDDIAGARAVAALAPTSRFAEALRGMALAEAAA